MRPERHNAVKVLLFLDIGGSMDGHIKTCAELFSAARAEFKHLEYFYFHNCPYEAVWKDAWRRHVERTPTPEVLHTYDQSYKLIFVGDASMSPYEIMQPGGSVEHWNEEPGEVWLRAAARDLSESGLAQPGAGALLGWHAVDRDGARAAWRAACFRSPSTASTAPCGD